MTRPKRKRVIQLTEYDRYLVQRAVTIGSQQLDDRFGSLKLSIKRDPANLWTFRVSQGRAQWTWQALSNVIRDYQLPNRPGVANPIRLFFTARDIEILKRIRDTFGLYMQQR